ncbi:hypothetical protein DEO72_LG2g4471 [Vigna unguiculata]|uniref:Uncharacterized protein n=1 Tax=Vigna unguiculata TaxID=3917 RepID=A0A4D6L6L9_VIGUN|nr:hypothetical protein DEO72_LG2g4470 [Vigna unguiculata]QCD84121.1 hypothetical protein DEO72_LG2g4471 [Vigna unguiculata]
MNFWGVSAHLAQARNRIVVRLCSMDSLRRGTHVLSDRVPAQARGTRLSEKLQLRRVCSDISPLRRVFCVDRRGDFAQARPSRLSEPSHMNLSSTLAQARKLSLSETGLIA